MPYKSKEEMNAALKGIDPPISLAMANMIAMWADDMAKNPPDKRPDNPWATAIKQFKDVYVARDGKWVRRNPPPERKERSTQEAFKTIDGKKRPVSDFLVVGDKEKPTTWHLPVKVNGRVDHGLMGAAHAALTKGHRGQTYKGPDKAKALSKLKALYKREEMPLPTEEKMNEEVRVAEATPGSLNDYLNNVAESFRKQFAPPPNSNQLSEYWINETFVDHSTMGTSVVVEGNGKYYMVPFHEADKGFVFDPMSDWQEVVKSWIPVSRDQQEAEPGGPEMCVCPECGAETEHGAGVPCRSVECPKCGEKMVAQVESQERDFAESEAGSVISLSESAETVPLAMDVCLIQPGWGNKKDNNFYPKEVLQRDAKRFVGAKMFEKDHTDDKTTRDWVSTIDSIVGETAEGGPIAKVLVHDPNFAERVRALNKAGKLAELPCSIMARGMAKEAEIDGKNGMRVEAITEVSAVDWVTAAGAGGHAVALSEQEAENMSPEEEVVEETTEELETTEDMEEVDIAEEDAEETETVEEQEPEYLSKEEVSEALEESGLPAAARAKLTEAKYTKEELEEAIRDMKAFVSDLTEAGKPFAQNTQKKKPTVTIEEMHRRQDSVNAQHLGIRMREVKKDD